MSDNIIIIQIYSIVLIAVTTGREAATLTVSKPFRVVTIYEKYYNKWLITKYPVKKWRGESISYKLDIHMLHMDILDEYYDVELVGHDLYKKSDICRTTVDSMIISVVGKLELSV